MEVPASFLQAVGDAALKNPMWFFTVATTLRVLTKVGAISKYTTPTEESAFFLNYLVASTLDRLTAPLKFHMDTKKSKKASKKAVEELEELCSSQELRNVVLNQDMNVSAKIIEVLSRIIEKLLETVDKRRKILHLSCMFILGFSLFVAAVAFVLLI